ncbi:hypothetical protein ACJRO7_031897 [Eucalyptus globulus]|uniref:Uncharacterized protein n=1 Tax=Eucalyptus globulus TaxID=34317 RepID=A0ABD3JL23_EUCGL
MIEICEELRDHSIKNNQPCNICIGGENFKDRPADCEIVPEVVCHGETSKIQTFVYFSKLSGEKESTGTRDISKGTDQESSDTHPTKHCLSLIDDSNMMNIINSKRKSKGASKEKKEDFDWDSLRRQ